jgi:hypothetical protein
VTAAIVTPAQARHLTEENRVLELTNRKLIAEMRRLRYAARMLADGLEANDVVMPRDRRRSMLTVCREIIG